MSDDSIIKLLEEISTKLSEINGTVKNHEARLLTIEVSRRVKKELENEYEDDIKDYKDSWSVEIKIFIGVIGLLLTAIGILIGFLMK